MDHLKRILVGVDFSLCAAAALQQAVRIGAWNRAEVTALHIVPMPIYGLPDGVFMPIPIPPPELLTDAAYERWENWPVARALGSKVPFEAVLGLPRMALVEQASRSSVDLLVLGAHGESDERRAIGTTAAGCVQQAKSKVLIVREGHTSRFRSVVACIDFSPTSRLALEEAIRTAAQDDAALHVLHVYSDPWKEIGRSEAIKTQMPDFDAKFKAAIDRRLHAFCEPLAHELKSLRCHVHTRCVDGHGKGIVEFIRHEACDLVVLGTRAKWNVRDFLWGSTAERVIREAPCSVLALKPPAFEHPRGA